MKEKILIENPNRFVLFPIQYDDIWEYVMDYIGISKGRNSPDSKMQL